FDAKRTVLRGAVKEIILDGRTRSIPTVTLNGGFLGGGARGGVNSKPRSTTQWGINSHADVVIRLPHPVEIADTFEDGRGAHLASEANLEMLARGRAMRWRVQ